MQLWNISQKGWVNGRGLNNLRASRWMPLREQEYWICRTAMISLEGILAAVPRLVPHGHFARGKQLKLEDMGSEVALDVSHERAHPS